MAALQLRKEMTHSSPRRFTRSSTASSRRAIRIPVVVRLRLGNDNTDLVYIAFVSRRIVTIGGWSAPQTAHAGLVFDTMESLGEPDIASLSGTSQTPRQRVRQNHLRPQRGRRDPSAPAHGMVSKPSRSPLTSCPTGTTPKATGADSKTLRRPKSLTRPTGGSGYPRFT